MSPAAPSLAGGLFTTESPGSPYFHIIHLNYMTSGKSKSMETVKKIKSVVSGDGKEGYMGRAQGIFRAVKVFSVIQ